MIQKLFNRKILTFSLFAVIIVNLLFLIYRNIVKYTIPYDENYWAERYLKSQWVNPNSKEPIGDDGLYAYAGWEYVHGRDPTTLNAEMPPLGKYLIGLSILIFNNQNVFALFSGLLVLFALYKLSQYIVESRAFALIIVALFSFEPLFQQQLQAPFLDLLYLSFLIIGFYCLLNNRLTISAIFFGLMAATKGGLSTLVLLGLTTILYFLIIKDWKKLKQWFLIYIIAPVVFILAYFKFFLLGHSLRDFLSVQKWALNFYAIGAKGSLDTVWLLLLTGKWKTWWNGMLSVSEWWIGWPVLFFGFIVYWIRLMVDRDYGNELLIAIWLLVYIFFLTFIPVWPRYLLLVLPFTYIILLSLISSVALGRFLNKK